MCIRDGKAILLGAKSLQRQEAKDMDPEERRERRGAAARLKRRRCVPDGHGAEDEEADELRGKLRGDDVIHCCTSRGLRVRREAPGACAALRPKNMRFKRPSRRKSAW